MKRTRLGLDIRAVAQNRAMARAMGIRSEWVDAMTFGLGSGIAGVAGVALSQLTNVGPNLGQAYIIDSFMVVVFGGVGNLWGTLIGGMSLGIVNKLLEPYAGAVLGKSSCSVALDPLHSAAAARAVPADRPGGGGRMMASPSSHCFRHGGDSVEPGSSRRSPFSLLQLCRVLNLPVPTTSSPVISRRIAADARRQVPCATRCWRWPWIWSGATAAS